MMDKNYDHQKYENEIYEKWEAFGAFEPKEGVSPAFSIIMPPPNANGELHLGHATFVVVSDALIRYHRMKGSPTLWLPGVDHAGILSQVSFEKQLAKEGKSRHDLGREEFVKQCYQFCIDNKRLMEGQMKALGASCDWSREKFTLDPEISWLVYETFERMYEDGLVYRGYRIVNWCTRCRSTLADVETEEKEQTDKLYYLDYGLATIATTRPETIFADVAIAVNPRDERHKSVVGMQAVVPISGKQIPVVSDEHVDMEFGTGALKITPGHDQADWEIGQNHKLPTVTVIDWDGKMMGEVPDEIKGLKVTEARGKIVGMLEAKLIKTEDLTHSLKVCERCGTVIEPLVSRQWFVKIKPLADKAIEATESGRVKIVPEKYEKMYYNWMRNIRDWPISRQIWWGHQLPVWYAKSAQKTEEQIEEYSKLTHQDTRARTDILESPIVSLEMPKGEDEYIQDPDTFDTWFSSGQWPFTTLASGSKSKLKMQNSKWIDENPNSDFSRFYPTSVMNTAYEILFLWVARMIMFGLYLTGEVPFKIALINGVLRDEKGAKMSKSKGNGVNPNEAIEKYGADAVRMALVAGRDNGNDLLITKQQMEERIRGYRNFSNKVWNIARFIDSVGGLASSVGEKNEDDEWILVELNKVTMSVAENMDKYRLGQAAEEVYDFVWHKFADVYIEKTKERKEEASPTLRLVLTTSLKLLHPFMPFVTEAIWQELKVDDSSALISAPWPSI